jgi:flavin-dependent dehydrogenase
MMGADIAVVGGGPAGITAALALAAAAPARADRIVVLEKETYPRDKICAGAVGDRGWRILEALDAAPTVPWVRVGGIQLDTRQASMRSQPGPIGRVVRRRAFDAALAERAIDRGIRVVQGCPVRSISVEADGATVATPQGDLRVKAVVGADGVGSVGKSQ